MPRSLIALGSNLGDRELALLRAVELLREHPQIHRVACSRLHETSPVGGAPGQGAFLNAAVSLETTLAPESLHAVLRQVEDNLGRQRLKRWAARAIDLDLLLYDALVFDTPALQVPHPRMAFRRFVLEPAVEVAADMVHPTIGWTVERLWEHLNTAPPYVALMGLPGSGKTALAASLAQAFQGRFLADPVAGLNASHPPDTPSHVYQRQIQFLVRRAGLLDRQEWPDGNLPAISDFYWDQCLAYAQLELDASGFEAFSHEAERARRRVMSPKMLVLLDLGAHSRRESDRLGGLMLRWAERGDVGPVLHVTSRDGKARYDEISAAIEAMR